MKDLVRISKSHIFAAFLRLILLGSTCLSVSCERNVALSSLVPLDSARAVESKELLSGTSPTETLQLEGGFRFVQTVLPKLKNFHEKIPFIGVVTPAKAVSLHFALPGRVSKCPAAEGKPVKAGEVICELDSRIVDLEIKRAQTAVESTQKILSSNFIEKQQRLFDAGVIGQTDFEQVRIQSETANASLKDSRTLLEMTMRKKEEHVIRAPWDGVVSTRGFATGQLVNPELEVGLLTSRIGFSVLRVEVRMHASWYGRMRRGLFASIDSVAGNKLKTELEGKVSELTSAVDPLTQSFKVWIDFSADANLLERVANGMLVKGSIERPVSDNGIVVPASSLITWKSDDTAQVFAVDSNHVLRLKEIRVEAYDDDEVLVAEGLSTSTRIVSRFAPDLYDGLLVRFKEEPTPPLEKK